MLDVTASADGLHVSFTEPCAGDAADPDAWFVQSWRYEPADSYGGPKVDVREHRVVAADAAGDGRSIRLAVPDLQPGCVVYLRRLGELVGRESGRPLWTSEAWLTVNALHPPGAAGPPPARPHAPVEAAAGWRPLFDGRSTHGWHNHVPPLPDGSWPAVRGWSVQDEALVRTGPGGDLVSDQVFEDFELQLDWRIAPGGNSGVFFLVDETPRADGSLPAVWETGIEMQVLDNERHVDGQDPSTSAGACYALYAPTHDDTRPAGHWNRMRVVKRGAHVEHWLNDRLQCAYDIGSDDWTWRVGTSKFARMPAFARAAKGRIALQNHGDEVAFRNVILRDLAQD
jgi:cytochrome c